MRHLLIATLCLSLAACAGAGVTRRAKEADIAYQPLMHAPCPDYLRARRIVKNDLEFAYLFSGYLSAANHMVSISVPQWALQDRFRNHIVDISQGMSTTSQMEWMDRYCGLHPEDTVQQGLYAMTNEMINQHQLQRFFYHIAK
jgi:hypothetical protein